MTQACGCDTPGTPEDAEEKRPDALREHPPDDQFCDLVLNGGVASGVVYPWALLELARHWRFKNIGGNSVGAVAAALAAAAEYGRCHGVEDAFEVLRRLPGRLARVEGGDPKLLRLFQPSPSLRRLFGLFLDIVGWSDARSDETGDETTDKSAKCPSAAASAAPQRLESSAAVPGRPTFGDLVAKLLTRYGVWPDLLKLLAAVPVLLIVWVAAAIAATNLGQSWEHLILAGLLALLALLAAFGFVLVTLARRLYSDLKALTKNGYGICKGTGQQAGQEGLVEWLHKGIQLSAGRNEEDPPLSFVDLWAAPRFGRAGPLPLPDGLQPPGVGIDLQMFASNVTQGRPVRLPLNDANTRLYFDPEEWTDYFPPTVLTALKRASAPYRPRSLADPDPEAENFPAGEDQDRMRRVLELPSGGMPIVVAARLSLCFPLLFSCVPVYAVDYEGPQKDRRLRRCWLSDGGLCTNFPIHLFDAAHPRWPTFAFLLDRRLKRYRKQSVWLPEKHLDGRGDNWQRGVPDAEQTADGAAPRHAALQLFGLLGGLLLTMRDWNDRVTGRLPQVRNRVVRMALRRGEGQLNLAMPRERILSMAHEYGTGAGKLLVERYAPDGKGVKTAWREHLYVRSMIELRALRRHLSGYARAVRAGPLPLRELLDDAVVRTPLTSWPDRPDPTAAPITRPQRQALERALQAVEALEAELDACQSEFGPYRPVLEPEMRLRPPI